MIASNMTREAVDRLISDLRSVIRDGQEVLRAGAGDLSEKGREARSQIEETIRNARLTCEELEARATEAARGAARAAESGLREHPLAVLGCAVGLGVLVGLLLNNHNHR